MTRKMARNLLWGFVLLVAGLYVLARVATIGLTQNVSWDWSEEMKLSRDLEASMKNLLGTDVLVGYGGDDIGDSPEGGRTKYLGFRYSLACQMPPRSEEERGTFENSARTFRNCIHSTDQLILSRGYARRQSGPQARSAQVTTEDMGAGGGELAVGGLGWSSQTSFSPRDAAIVSVCYQRRIRPFTDIYATYFLYNGVIVAQFQVCGGVDSYDTSPLQFEVGEPASPQSAFPSFGLP